MPVAPRPNIQSLDAYTPGEQPSFRETGGTGGTDGVIKLNTNENPYPPSDAVMQALRRLEPEALRLYPPADAARFRHAAATLHGLTPRHVIATNGGDELLRLLLTCYCNPTPGSSNPPPGSSSPKLPNLKPRAEEQDASASSDEAPDPLLTGAAHAAESPGGGGGGIGMTSPSYTLYQVLAAIQDTPVTIVERGDGFTLPGDYIDRLNAAGCELAFLVNPHAPTGRLEPIDRLRDMAHAFRGLLVIDEAYVDFAPHDALDLLREGIDNVVLLRSLSKGYSLAGLRFGYGLAHPAIIDTLDKARDSYNTDILAQAAAVAALQDQATFRDHRDRVVAERQRLADQLRRRGFTVPDSHSNFLLATPPPRKL